MRRRPLPLALVALTCSVLVGCGSSDDAGTAAGPTSPRAISTTDTSISTPLSTSEVPLSELPPPPPPTASAAPSVSSAPGGPSAEQPAPSSDPAPSSSDGGGAAEPTPSASGSAGASSAPAEAAPERVWGYGTGDLSQWSEVQVARPEQVQVVTDPVRPGYEYSGAFTAGPGDHTFGVDTTIRGEVRSTIEDTGSPAEGDDQWYSWSVYFPEDFVWDGEDQFLIYTQWHQTQNSGQPNVDLWVTDGDDPQLRMSVRGGLLGDESQHAAVYDLGPLTRGQWLDHTVHVTWSSDPDVGRTTVWVNGERKVNAAAANLYVGQSVYLKQGIYAANNTDREHTVYFSDALRGDSKEAVVLPPAG